MADPGWFEGYSGQSTAELLASAGAYRIDSLVLAFEEGIEQRAATSGYDSLTETEIAVLAIEALEREVNNGGYSQFFSNESAAFAPVIVDALRRIGCLKTADVTARAIATLGGSAKPTREHVQSAIAVEDPHRDRQLEDCDADYFASGEDIAGVLFSYIKANPHEVRLPVA